MVNIKFNTIEDMIDNLQNLKGKTKNKFHRKISEYSDQRNYMRQN